MMMTTEETQLAVATTPLACHVKTRSKVQVRTVTLLNPIAPAGIEITHSGVLICPAHVPGPASKLAVSTYLNMVLDFYLIDAATIQGSSRLPNATLTSKGCRSSSPTPADFRLRFWIGSNMCRN
jgi:hypothetical protein